MKSFLALLCVLATVPAFAADAKTPYKIRWFIGHSNLDYFEQAAADFKKNVEARSHGDITVEIFSGTDIGTSVSPESTQIAGMVSRGEVQMGHSFTDVMGEVEPGMKVFETPELFRGYRHMEGVLDGPVGQGILDGLKAKGITGLSFTYSGGANGMATTGREVRKPEDLKGLRVACYGDDAEKAWLSSLGATPVPIRHKLETILPQADQNGIDAVVTTWRNMERGGLDRRFSRMNLAGVSYLVSVTYANQKFFESLPKEYQALLLEESRKAGRVERARTIELNEQAKREMLARGVRPVPLTSQDRKAFDAALQPAYATLDGLLGKGLMAAVRATPDAAEHPELDALAKK